MIDLFVNAVSDELKPFQEDVRRWLKEQMEGGAGFAWSATWTTRDNAAEYDFRRTLGRALGEKGWLFPTYPAEYGGGGLTSEHQAVLEVELAKYGLRLMMVYYTLARIVAPCIKAHGTAEQKRAFLPGMVRGKVVTWQLLTEPQSGSDVANCQTRAVRDDDDYLISGQKVMVGSQHEPDYLWVLACTDPGGKRHENLAWFYIPATLDGITIQPMQMMMGVKNTVFFDNVRVPSFNLIGGANNGWAVGRTQLELEHGGAGSVSGYDVAERLVDFCRQTTRHGRPLLAHGRVREQLAELLIDTHVCRLLALRNYWGRLSGQPHAYGGAQYRYYERMLRLRNARRVQEIVGYDSLIPNLEVHESDDFEYVVRAGPGQLHGGGTMDTDRLIIARRMGIGRDTREEAPTTI